MRHPCIGEPGGILWEPPRERKYKFGIMRQGELRRRFRRLRGRDYSSPGAYFIIACTQNRLPLFGRIIDGKMAANRLGAVVEECSAKLPDHYDNVALDAFILMPNHVHGVIIIEDTPTLTAVVAASARRYGVPEIMRAFKTFSARNINELRVSPGAPVWQRGFYDHVIRGKGELDTVRTYIMDSPGKWSEDADNPANRRGQRRV